MAVIEIVNPRKRRKARKARARRRRSSRRSVFSSNPRRRRRRRAFRRNPIVSKSEVKAAGIGAMTAAFGAVALDAAWANLPIPEAVKVGPLQLVAKGVGAIGLGVAARSLAGKRTGDLVTLGALTVLAYQMGRAFLIRTAPALKLGIYEGGGGMGAYFGTNAASFPLGGALPCPKRPALPAKGVGSFDEDFASQDDYNAAYPEF